MEKGTLITKVYTSGGAMPVPGASVTITAEGPGGVILRSVRVSDGSGNTAPVEIETPNETLSQAPSKLKPFTSATIRIDHPLYVSVLIRGAQIFANQKSLQPVNLIPLKQFAKPDEKVIQIDVPPQDL